MDYDNLHDIADTFKVIQMMELLHRFDLDMTPFQDLNLGMTSAQHSTDIFFRIIDHLFEIIEVTHCDRDYHESKEIYENAVEELDYWLGSIQEYDGVDYIVILDDRFTPFSSTSGGGYYTANSNASFFEIHPTNKGMVIIFDTDEGFPDFGEIFYYIMVIFSRMHPEKATKQEKEETAHAMAY